MIAVLSVILLPNLAACAGAASAPPTSVMSAGPSTAVDLTPTPTGVARFTGQGFSFDYPAAWSFQPYSSSTSFFTVIGYLGNEPVDTASICTTTASSTSCHFGQWGHAPDAVIIELASWGAPMHAPVDFWVHPPGGSPTSVGGMPAVVSSAASAAGRVVRTWKILRPDALDNWIQLDADIARRITADVQSDLDALIASFAFDPPPIPLAPGDANRIGTTGLASLKAENPSGFACYPPPGETVDVTIRAIPGGPSPRPFEGTCSTTMVATPIGFWRLDLTMSWPQLGSVAAGHYTTSQWFTANGRVLGQTGSGDTPPLSP